MTILEKIIDAHDMSEAITVIKHIPHTRNTIGIKWRGVEGTPDGELNLYGANLMIDEADFSLIHTLSINAEDNKNDTTHIHISAPVFTLIKFIYTPNNITAGELSADINGSDE